MIEMNLWLLMMILCSATAVGVSIPLIRHLDGPRPVAEQDSAIYLDQLKEVDRDLQSGNINTAEAESSKIEIQRRLAYALKNPTEARPISPILQKVALAVTAGLVIIGSVSLYGILGSPNLPSGTLSTPTAQPVEALVQKLTERLQKNPKDAEGWQLLGRAQFNLQHFSESIDAYASALKLDPANIEYKSAYAEAITQGSQGIVTPKAIALFAEVLKKEPKNPRARFYEAISLEQSGDAKTALTKWRALLADAPMNAAWRDEVKNRLNDLAASSGQKLTEAEASTSAPALTDEQKAQVQALSAGDQQAMIKSMVQRLADKMAANPNDLEGWMRLMRAYKVLNEPIKAKDALSKALATFSADPSSLAKLKATASELGID
jgi:cytochrome c-type biogenesis protein CcmH